MSEEQTELGSPSRVATGKKYRFLHREIQVGHPMEGKGKEQCAGKIAEHRGARSALEAKAKVGTLRLAAKTDSTMT